MNSSSSYSLRTSNASRRSTALTSRKRSSAHQKSAATASKVTSRSFHLCTFYVFVIPPAKFDAKLPACFVKDSISYDKVIEHLRNDQLKRRIDRLMTQINCPRPKQFQLYNADKSIYYLNFSTSIKLSDTKPLDVSRLCRIKICATPVFESFDDSNVFDMIVAAFMDPLGKRGIDETKAVNKEAANVIESLISSAESGVVHLPVPVLQAVHATLRKPYSVELGRSLLELKSEATFTKDKRYNIIRAIQPTAVQIKQYLINSDGISPFHGKLDILINHSIVVMVQRTQSEDSEDGSDSEDEVVQCADIVAEVKAPANR